MDIYLNILFLKFVFIDLEREGGRECVYNYLCCASFIDSREGGREKH